MEYCVTIDILRHGECEDGHVFRGSTDVALTPKGFDNMLNVVEQVNTQWDVIISSPLKRCLNVAQYVSQQYDASKPVPVQVESDLKELHFGDWEAQPIEDVWQNDTATIEQWMQDPSSMTPKNGEPIKDFYHRVVHAYQKCVLTGKEKRILMITHGGVIRCVFAHILNLPFTQLNTFDVPYAGLSQIKMFVSPKGNITKIMHINGIKPCVSQS